MSRDDSRQKVGGVGVRIDAGAVEFTTTGTTVVVDTPLSFILAGHGTTETGKAVATCPDGVVTNNQVTFTRTDTTNGDTLHYTLYGY